MKKQTTHSLGSSYKHSLEVQCGIAVRRIERRLGCALTEGEYKRFWDSFYRIDRLEARQLCQFSEFGYRVLESGHRYLTTGSKSYPLTYVARRAA